MIETRTDLTSQLVDATVAASRGDIRHACAVAEQRQLNRSARRVLALALIHHVRSARRPVEPVAIAVTS